MNMCIRFISPDIYLLRIFGISKFTLYSYIDVNKHSGVGDDRHEKEL